MTRDELLLAIVRCPEVGRARADTGHPCHGVVCFQGQTADAFQAPEPWRGHIDTAPILFLSSNPSIAENDPFRASSSSDAEIIDYYQCSFDPDAGHISPSAYNSVPFWRGVRARATEILGRDAVPGVDFALTELVHCKSTGEQGVARAHLTWRDGGWIGCWELAGRLLSSCWVVRPEIIAWRVGDWTRGGGSILGLVRRGGSGRWWCCRIRMRGVSARLRIA